MVNLEQEKNSNSRKDKENNKGFMNQLTVEELIKAGAHFGHPTHRWNPNYKGYITMKKNGVYIIDMEQTSQCMVKAAKEITRIVREGGNVLFVGTKKQAKDAVQQAADRCSMYYIVERWLGGTLTNYGTIKKSIKRLLILSDTLVPHTLHRLAFPLQHVFLSFSSWLCSVQVIVLKLQEIHRQCRLNHRLEFFCRLLG